jgi:Ran-binding protein 9/10
MFFSGTFLGGRVQSLTMAIRFVGMGFATRYVLLNRMPGWDTARGPTWGYHGDDGGIFIHSEDGSRGHLYGPKYTTGDTVGCGVDFDKGVIFFTKNGVLLGA